MRNIFIILFLFGIVHIDSYCQVVSPKVYISNFEYKGDRMEISYGFENCDLKDSYYIWIEVYNQSNKKLNAKSFLGNEEPVSPTPDKKLIWFADRDSVLIDDNIYIKLFAAKKQNLKLSKAYLFSTLCPGLGHKQVGGKNKLYLGAIGYAGIGGAIVMNHLAYKEINNYRSSIDPIVQDDFFKNAKTYQLLSYTSIGASVAILALDYFLLQRTLKKSKNATIEEIKINFPQDELLSAQSQTKYISGRGLPPNLFAQLSFADDNDNLILEANEKSNLTIDITNQGKGNAYDLKIKITDDKLDKSFKIGEVDEIQLLRPNESKKITIPITSDIKIKTAEHKLKITVTEKYGFDMDPAFLVLQSFEYQPAKMSFSGLEIFDAGQGTAAIIEDGQLQVGEEVKVKIVIQNIGQGLSKNTCYEIKTTDTNIFLRDNTGNLGSIESGEVKEIYVSVSPNKRVISTDPLPIFLDIKEEQNMGNLISYQLPISLNQKPPQTNIITLNTDTVSLKKNVARFEYNSNKFIANTGAVMNIQSVVPSKMKRTNSVAVVFGIEDYENIAPAPYADNDAVLMKDYFEKVMGIEKVYLFTNSEATYGKLNKTFNPNYGDLQKVIVPGETELFVFFSGHGIPDKSGKNIYLFPYDGIKEDLDRFGYNINNLYDDLSKLQAKSVTVIIDACFSGSSRKTEKYKEENLVAQKGVIIEAKKPWVNNSAFTMISSSTGEETSLGFDPSETGLFTYYFCAGLQGKADENGDNKITLGELKRYVSNKVIETSKKISGLQTPEFGGNEDAVWVEY